MKYGLKNSTIQKICTVFVRYRQVEKTVLYGSRASGSYKNGSDIDLTMFGGDDLTPQVLYRIMDEIDDLLLPYTFDLTILRYISDPAVIDHIKGMGVTFYEKAVKTTHA